MAVMPLTLRQLEVIRYRTPQGQSQELTTKTVIQMFREAQFWDVVPEQILKVILLNTIQTTEMMTKVQERLREDDNWEVVRNHIITLDRASAMSKDYMNTPRRERLDGAMAQTRKKEICLACGRKGHLQKDCKTAKDKLKCDFCKTTKQICLQTP